LSEIVANEELAGTSKEPN